MYRKPDLIDMLLNVLTKIGGKKLNQPDATAGKNDESSYNMHE